MTNDEFQTALIDRIKSQGLASVMLEIAQIAEDIDRRDIHQGWGIDAYYIRAMVERIKN